MLLPSELADLSVNPVPEGGRVIELRTSDHVRLRAAFWPATVAQPRGTVCLFQGRAEQIEKYFEVIGDLRERGFAVATLDWRGQGGSSRLLRDPRPGHVRRFSDYLFDLEAFWEGVVQRFCPQPWYGLAHSMGGNILMQLVLARRTIWMKRIVMTAPFFDFGAFKIGRARIRQLSTLLCGLGLAGRSIPKPFRKNAIVRSFEGNPLTHDRDRFERTAGLLEFHPELGIDAPTIGWVRAAEASMRWLGDPRLAFSVTEPILMIGCGADRVVSTAAVERVARRLKTAAYVGIPGARHEIMMESDVLRDAFWASFDAFIPGSDARPPARDDAAPGEAVGADRPLSRGEQS